MDLETLRERLLRAVKTSGQQSYARRAAGASAQPEFVQLRSSLLEYVQEHPDSVEAWQLLSRTQECLLDYSGAAKSLSRAMELGEKSKKDMKRLAMLRSQHTSWSKLRLTPNELAALGEFLEVRLAAGPGERNLQHTREWLKRNRPQDDVEILQALDEKGAFSDFQVLHNIVHG